MTSPFSSPATHVLRYDQVRFKASHNSYNMKVPLKEQLGFDYSKPRTHGFRGLELDVHQDTKGCGWCVRHNRGACKRLQENRDADDAGPDCLGAWLTYLAQWSTDHADHDVVTLTLDIKRVVRPLTFPSDMDDLLRASGLEGARLFTPGEFQDVWPTLGELKGKFIVCLSGSESVKSDYATHAGRLCFADVSLGPGQLPPVGDQRLFLNYNWREFEIGSGNAFQRPSGRPYIVRAYGLRKDPALGSWNVAEAKGVNIMSTDWRRRLAVGSEPFAQI